MKKLIVLIILLAGAAYFLISQGYVAKFQEYITLKHMIRLTSSAFVDNGLIPSVYTCQGQAYNPPLDIADVPGGTLSMVLIVEDPDAPGATYTHWVIFNILPSTNSIPEKGVPQGAILGKSTSGTIGYEPPCPPTGTHRYIFNLYALDTTLNLPEGASKMDVQEAIKDHIIDKTQLIGRYVKTN